MNNPEITQAIKDLSSPLAERREQALTTLLTHHEEATPELLEILKKVLAVPLGTPVALSDWSWFLAAYLLAQFREKEALSILLEQFSMPAEHVDRLFKDILVEDLPRILATLTSDDPTPLRALTENEKAHDAVRASALWGYTILASVGLVSQKEVTDYYAELFTGKIARRPSFVWTSLVAGCAALHAKPLKREILRAYEEELLDASAYSMKEVLQEWSLTPEESLKRLAEESGGLIRDVWEEMEFWPWEEEAGREASEE
ncbi:MAG TPA: DUF1186 domain-containing protein [bacterium]|nr:DUF1186 domain-containing protein [bacterium]